MIFKRFLLGVLAICLVSLGFACDDSPSGNSVDKPVVQYEGNVGKLTGFTAQDVVTGEFISLNDFEGSVVLLNFVNYGCNARQSEIVSSQLLVIRELQQQRNDFVPVSVFCGCCPKDVLIDFAQENDLDWPWILDTEYVIVQDYEQQIGRYGYPTLVFIDASQIVQDITGYTEKEALSAKIDEISQ
ncbi:MAG: redoxin domain-containing protein [Chloroflexota bacterium]|nr:redoxin domain-containing protein [Chloroflexota bacterium]